MSLTYVIPDIHGRNDLLAEALERISAHSGSQAGVIVTTGDYVGKGADSKAVVDRLLLGVGAPWRLVPLKGNHDAMMLDVLRDPAMMPCWLSKGGDAALASYGGDLTAVPATHVAWLEKLALLHIDAHRVYVHAGVDPAIPLDRQSEKTLLWKRYPKEFSQGIGRLHVVHGHDSHSEGPLLYKGRTNLDTGAWRTGRLMVGVFDDDRPGGPIELLTVKGPPAEG